MNRRKFSRVRFRMTARVTSAERRFLGTVENLSMNGMYIVTPERLNIDEPVEITLLLDGATPGISLNFYARVRRIDENGLGFIFEMIDVDTYIHLKKIVSYNVKDPEEVTEEIHRAIHEKLKPEKL